MISAIGKNSMRGVVERVIQREVKHMYGISGLKCV